MNRFNSLPLVIICICILFGCNLESSNKSTTSDIDITKESSTYTKNSPAQPTEQINKNSSREENPVIESSDNPTNNGQNSGNTDRSINNPEKTTDTEINTPDMNKKFEVVTDSNVTFAIREKLLRVPAPFDAILVSDEVSGYVNLDGSPFELQVDLHKLVSDKEKRDKYVRETLFPNQPISTVKFDGLTDIPESFYSGHTIERVVSGTVNVNGVDSVLDFDLSASLMDGQMAIKGNASFEWSNFGMDTPTGNFFKLSDEVRLSVDIAAHSISPSMVVVMDDSFIPDYLFNPWLCVDGDKYVKDLTSDNVLECKVELNFQHDVLLVTTTGIPSHDFESTIGCCASEQQQTWSIPINPIYSGDVVLTPERGPVAFAVNGAAIYGPEEGPGGDAVALHFGKFEEDRQPIELGVCGGHSGPGGQYHYHFDANCFHWHPDSDETIFDYSIEKLLDLGNIPQIIGFAFDGFPIYGLFGWDSDGNVKEMRSSYKLKEGSTGYNGIEDYIYVPNLGDLDECNGHFYRTPDVPDGIYHYHSTIHNGEGGLGFPYFIYCYHGEVDESNLNHGAGPFGAGPPGGPHGGGPPDPDVIRERLQKAGITVPEGTSDQEIIQIYGPMLGAPPR